ncbi:RNA polymerase subunit sigma [Sporosarcina sp. GW1-11]|uniref:RNA polymerase subunit sigma n=1 Tax=Sporosarcina sp. GW1-11 TaxID=2899126 RepID=UPI00294C4D30|nr:RNA polymerase subunit sigma [Sporosarcina sp. GW1-11]MDV6376690.1 RNA polymerase subunit sigma [Sporosarcina sp. GW1-11]
MSLKSIELQIAIPKTFEAGKIAEQKQQQSQIDQQHANTLTEKQVRKNKESVLELAPYAKLDANAKRPNDQSEQQQNEKQEKEQQRVNHPFKGSFVDYSG